MYQPFQGHEILSSISLININLNLCVSVRITLYGSKAYICLMKISIMLELELNFESILKYDTYMLLICTVCHYLRLKSAYIKRMQKKGNKF